MNRFSYAVSVELPLTLEEVAHLANLARQHYDQKCRDTRESFLRDWETRIRYGTGVSATWSQLDILCKVCEMDQAYSSQDDPPRPDLCDRLDAALTAVSDEQRRVNGMEPKNLVFHINWPADKAAGQRPGASRASVTFEHWWDPRGLRAPAEIPVEVRERLRNVFALLSPRGAQVRDAQEYRRWAAEVHGEDAQETEAAPQAGPRAEAT